MPRCKNPNPHQVNQTSRINTSSPTQNGSTVEEEENLPIPESLSPPDLEISDHGDNVEDGEANGASQIVNPDSLVDQIESIEDENKDSDFNQNPEDGYNYSQQSDELEMSLANDITYGRKKTFPSLGNHNPKILTWFRRRFILREGSNASASHVIKQYEKDFPNFAMFPLHNFQVGHFLRRIFPNIERCKVTSKGKRTWVYRHLCIREDAGNVKQESQLNEAPSSPIRIAPETTVDLRRSSRVRRIKSFDNDYDCTVEDKSEKDTADSRMGAKRKVRNSGILYSLLYPHREGNSHYGKSDTRTFTRKPASFYAKKKVPCKASITEWLREHYEYAEGFYVRSLDVMRRYNKDQESYVQYLSQVGKFIKVVFPNAKHMRKTMKGGKREWVYQNIRSKSEDYRSPVKTSYRPSMVPIKSFQQTQSAKNTKDENSHNDFNDITLPTLPSELSSIYVNEDNVSSCALLTESVTSTNTFHTSKFSVSGRATGGQVVWHDAALPSATNKNPQRRSVLESHIDRLRNTIADSEADAKLRKSSANISKTEESLILPKIVQTNSLPQMSKVWSIKTAVPIRGSQSVSVIHREIPSKRKLPGATEGEVESPKVSIIKLDKNVKVRRIENGFNQACSSDAKSESKTIKVDTYKLHNEGLLSKPAVSPTLSSPQEMVQWIDLKDYKSHPSGWAATPTRPDKARLDFFEWVLFEADTLCDSVRVFRELRIYDDWSVSIHVMGKKVYADEVGGITDLKRTWKSIDKVMETLADAKLCRGFASHRLSDMMVHGVIVAKPEIWSKRNIDNEELRHRAINCQVLHRLDDVCCIKCGRISMLNRQKTTIGKISHRSNT